MTPKERVFNRLNGKKVDRIPNFNIIMMFAAKQAGIPYSKYVTDYRTFADVNLGVCEKFGIDLLCAISDPMREAQGFGAKVEIPYDDVPYSKQPFIEEFSEYSAKLKVYDPIASPRTADRIFAIQRFREIAPQYAIAGWVEGAFAECCDLREISNFMMDVAVEEPEDIHNMLEICNQNAIRFALAQIEAGADIVGIGDAACSLISPDMFREFGFPYEKKLIDAIHSAGAKAKLHICGNTTKLLPNMAMTGADIIDIDWMVDYSAAARELCPHNICISGNFDPVAVVLQSSPDKIREKVKECIALGDARAIVAAGCEIPKDTPTENLLAVHQAIFECQDM